VEEKEARKSLMLLSMKKIEQRKELKSREREHRMCVKELALNIAELENISDQRVESDVLNKIILACPIECDFPALLAAQPKYKERSVNNEMIGSDARL